jgi:hypothetical protein
LQVNKGHLGEDATLSHCWGTGDRLTLTKNRLNAFQDAIPYADLPKTFQDAILLTKALGIRFLWIDALCILQDQDEDWKHESASMCAVYQNSLLSLSALAATDSHSGMFFDRTSPYITVTVNESEIGVRQRLDSLPQALARSRLETRAWCYQERLLPEAILHVGPQQLFWECRAGSYEEARPVSLTSNSRPAPMHSMTPERSSEIIGIWLQLVTEYSAREVTKATDRLPAILGMADATRKALGGVPFKHGIFSIDIHLQLLWSRRKNQHSKVIPSRDKYLSRTFTRSTQRLPKKLAPSWSWISVNDAVDFPLIDNNFTTLQPASILNFDKPQNEGRASSRRPSRHLYVEGLLIRGSCKPSAPSSDEPDEANFKPSGSTFRDDGLSCSLDYIEDPVSKGCYCLRVANCDVARSSSSKKRRGDNGRMVYLILERVTYEGDGASSNDVSIFQRIGMGFDDSAKVDKVFSNADQRTLLLV